MRTTLLQRFLKKNHPLQIQQKLRTVDELQDLAEKKRAEGTHKVSTTKKLSKSCR